MDQGLRSTRNYGPYYIGSPPGQEKKRNSFLRQVSVVVRLSCRLDERIHRPLFASSVVDGVGNQPGRVVYN